MIPTVPDHIGGAIDLRRMVVSVADMICLVSKISFVLGTTGVGEEIIILLCMVSFDEIFGMMRFDFKS